MAAPAALRVAAPAKVNLGLRVVGRRDDGYHLLESLFVPLALADTLHFDFAAAPGVHLEVERTPVFPADMPLPDAADNLITRAAEGFCELAGISPRLAIRLEKAVPMGAGLGGGSSDAGAVLRTLAATPEGRGVSRDALDALAVGLGADVPFFLDPRPTRVSGIGEILAPERGFPPLCLLLVNPGEPLATASVFKAFAEQGAALTLAPPGSTMLPPGGPFGRKNPAESSDSTTASPLASERGDVLGVSAALARALDEGLLDNDLEAAATKLCPAIAEWKDALGELGARWVGMSGSGATVYGIFEEQKTAQRAKEGLETKSTEGNPGHRMWSCVTQTTGPVPTD